MNLFAKLSAAFLCSAVLYSHPLLAQNQTEALSPVFSHHDLPFEVEIEAAHFNLPQGLQAYASAIYKNQWVLIGGRTNGLHNFSNEGNNFPPSFQNRVVYIVDPCSGEVWSRSLTDPCAELSQSEIDALSVTASQFFQQGDTLYLVGGYGINTATGEMETKNTLSAIDLNKLSDWVKQKKTHIRHHIENRVKKWIRQTADPLLQVTGGFLFRGSQHDPFLLMLGQNFAGLYRGESNGIYTMQIRSFWLKDDGKELCIIPNPSPVTFPDYRRRDLNIAPILRHHHPAYVAFAGVFTLETGVWTVPITIFPNGSSFEPDPSAPETFKQAMNHYNCATFGLYSAHSDHMYVTFAGGISYGFFADGIFQTDAEIPFTNQFTTIKIDKHDQFTQYLMEGRYPFIPSNGSNAGNELLFGSEAQFFPAAGIPTFKNGVIELDKLPAAPIVIGYIAGGIMSTLPNTNGPSDSAASPYVFKVKLVPKHRYPHKIC